MISQPVKTALVAETRSNFMVILIYFTEKIVRLVTYFN